MKALHFAKPLELRLETEAEELIQGQTFAGTLSVTNRGGNDRGDLVLDLGLAFALFKEIKADGAAAFQMVERSRILQSAGR